VKGSIWIENGRIFADSSDHILADAGKIPGKLVDKRRKKIFSRTAFCVHAREKEGSREPLFFRATSCHRHPSHPFSYSERNSRLSDTRGAVQPNESTTMFSVV
jgi:hypothetical protein